MKTWWVDPGGRLIEMEVMEVDTQAGATRPCNIDGSGHQGRAKSTSVRGEAGGIEDQDRAGGKVEHDGAE